MSLAGQVVLVTGSSRRLGRVIALAYAHAGVKVVVNGASDQAAVDQTVAEVQAAGVDAIGCLADVRDRAQVGAMVDRARAELGPIDILVNCPAPREEFPFAELPAEVWQRTLDIVLTGSFNCAQAVIPGMLEVGRGTILNIIGIAGQTGRPHRAHIVAAKSGLVGLTRSLAVEYGAREITVNAISPAFLQSDRPRAPRPERPAGGGAEGGSSGGNRISIPVGRQGTREEVAALCLFLSSNDARYITGQNYAINGGAYI
jgi:NAD(P)-dependent dehydrogenase (short-subunit alcohol dehydrogenase family)